MEDYVVSNFEHSKLDIAYTKQEMDLFNSSDELGFIFLPTG